MSGHVGWWARWGGWGLVVACVSTSVGADIDAVKRVTGLSASEREAMLQAHNRWRAQVSVPPLVWSDALAQSAARWAAQLDQGGQCGMQHSDVDDLGENLYWASPVRWNNGQRTQQEIRPAFVVDVWGQESADFQAATNLCRPGKTCGHYTQIVWRATREVGCAMRVCGAQDQVWVCQYLPAGNYIGQRPY